MSMTAPPDARPRDGELLAAAAAAAGRADAAVDVARRFGRALPLPGRGETGRRWAMLGAVAAVDLTVARVLEAHTDAQAILVEAGRSAEDGGWGVFAARAPGAALRATDLPDGTSLLHGTKPWCSLAARLDRALVTAERGTECALFAVDLHADGVQVQAASGWTSRGLAGVESGPVRFQRVPARGIGPPGWYLDRPGFAWGGIGVAACWLGAAQALAATLRSALVERASELTAMHLGAVDVALYGADAALRDAAVRVDEGSATGSDGAALALRVRSAIVHAAELTMTHVGHALGPAPLCFDEEHARRVADLQVYLRQHHAERDLAALGRLLVGSAPA